MNGAHGSYREYVKCLEKLQERVSHNKRRKISYQYSSADNFLVTAPKFTWPQSIIFLSMGHLETPVHEAPIGYKETFNRHYFYVCQTILNHPCTLTVCDSPWSNLLRAFTDSGGRYFEHWLWIVTLYTIKIQRSLHWDRVLEMYLL